nr:hypothetical protein [Streptomyces sp. XY152]
MDLERAQCLVDGEQCVDFLADELGGPGAQDEAGAAQAVFEFGEAVLDLPALVVKLGQLPCGGLPVVEQAGRGAELLHLHRPVLGPDGDGVVDDAHEVSVGQPCRGAALEAGVTQALALGRGGHDGHVRAVGQDPQRWQDEVLLDPPGEVAAGRLDQAPQFMAGEVAVGQQQYAGPQGGEQAAGELVLAEPGDRVKGRVDDGVGAALDEGHQSDLWISALVGAVVAGESERDGVLGSVRNIQRGAVPGDQPQTEGECSRGRGCRLGAAPAFEEGLQRLVSQALAGSGEGRTGGQALDNPARQVPQFLGQGPQDRPVSRRPSAVGAAEQAQGQDEVDHRAGREKPAAALGPSGQLHYFVDYFRCDLLGEYAEPDPVAELRLRPPSGTSG